MKLLKIMTAGTIISILATTVWAQTGAPTAEQAPIKEAGPMDHMKMHQQHMQQAQAGNMPMMGAGCDHMKKDPAMMDNMMRMRQQQMWQGSGPQGRMPMMGGGSYERMMDPVMRKNMMQMRQQKMMKMRQGGMMNPEMMKKRQQHMQTMEQRLSNIEKLLTELVELQKKK